MPMFLEILFSNVEMWFFHVKFSSIIIPKNLIAFSRFIGESLTFKIGNFNGILSRMLSL